MGFEQVNVPSGPYVAVKLEVTISVSGKVAITIPDTFITVRGNLSGSVKQTLWAVPNVGIVKGISDVSLTVSVPVLGSGTVKAHESSELTSFLAP